MATGGVLGNGVKVGYSSASPVSWTKVAALMDQKLPEETPDDVDITVHSTGGYYQNMPGLKKVSDLELSFLADLDPTTTASHAALKALKDAGTILWWRIEVPTNRAQTQFCPFEFQGAVSSWNIEAPTADKQMLKVSVKFQGAGYYMLFPGASALG